ncbi:PRC-barrel domain-containing protein [Alkaliphilus crotonatoxidans]
MKITGQLIGLPILNEEIEAQYLIKEPIYFTSPLKLWGFLIQGAEGGKKKWAVNINHIKKITKDGIWIQHRDDIINVKGYPEILAACNNNHGIIGYDIRDQYGELVGLVKDTIIDEENGVIKAFIISQGIISDLSEGYSILPLVPEIKLEDSYVQIEAFTLEELLLNQEGGLKKMLGIYHKN